MKKKLLLVSIAIIVVVAVLGLALIFVNAGHQNAQAQERALQGALDYRPSPGLGCTQSLTPAVHIKTGARHTFQNGCLPPGWEYEAR